MKKSHLRPLLVAGVALVGAFLVGPQTAGADETAWYTGPCVEDDALTGVTVVVDFQELDGNDGVPAPTLVRCSPAADPETSRTGVEALQDAGLAVTGTAQWGLAFICRIENRPGPAEPLPTGLGTHVEACVLTPPASAYWSYWHADGSDSTWTYSSFGAANRTVVPGGFEGWSFSLNRTATTNPEPGVAPYNPEVDPDAPTVSLSVDELIPVIDLGESTTLTWNSSNAVDVIASAVDPATGGGSWSGSLGGSSGTVTITPTAAGVYTYEITAIGANGQVSTTATLTVQ